MDKKVLLRRLQEIGLVATLGESSPGRVVGAVEALVAGGVRGIEIAGTMKEAVEVVRAIHLRYGDAVLLGMGSLTKPEQVATASEAGAQFLASAIVEQALAEAMADTGRLLMLGALTPTEVAKAQGLGCDVVRVFPGASVAPSYLKALRGPFPKLPMAPGGGVTQENVGDWFEAGAVAVCVGSELCPEELVADGRFEEITARAAAFVAAVEVGREAVAERRVVDPSLRSG